jgi:hypothetical protein
MAVRDHPSRLASLPKYGFQRIANLDGLGQRQIAIALESVLRISNI